ncbi:MAG: hypothetical protein AAF402_12805 [Pseudomonadota bacterium]
MLKSQSLAKPQTKSVLGSAVFAVLVAVGIQASPVLGYFLALLALVMIVIAMHTKSIWPTQANRENSLVFSMFWGLMAGAVAPFLVVTFLHGGFSAIYEIFAD